eukprot:gene7438-42815_t
MATPCSTSMGWTRCTGSTAITSTRWSSCGGRRRRAWRTAKRRGSINNRGSGTDTAQSRSTSPHTCPKIRRARGAMQLEVGRCRCTSVR